MKKGFELQLGHSVNQLTRKDITFKKEKNVVL